MASASATKRLDPLVLLEADQKSAIWQGNEGTLDQFAIGCESIQSFWIGHRLDNSRTESAITLTTGIEQRSASAEMISCRDKH